MAFLKHNGCDDPDRNANDERNQSVVAAVSAIRLLALAIHVFGRGKNGQFLINKAAVAKIAFNQIE